MTHTISELGMDGNWICRSLLMDRLNINEGMFVENAIAQIPNSSGHRLFYYSRSDPDTRRNSIEIDFLIMVRGDICPVEVKSSVSTKHVSLDKFREKFGKRIGQPYVLCLKDVEEKDGILYLPLYMPQLL